jgi:beta-lactamase class A
MLARMQHPFRLLALAAATLLCAPTAMPCLALAQTPPPSRQAEPEIAEVERAFARYFAGDGLEARLFAPVLLQEVPLARLRAIRDALLRDHGAWRGVARDGERWSVVLERARVPARIAFDREGRIRSLHFDRALAVEGDAVRAAAAFEALPGRTALLVIDDGRARIEREADAALGAGSAFKMLVLREYVAAVAAGRLAAAQVVTLREQWRAPGPGPSRGWPVGMPVTLATLAAMMISVSDNTATDALMALIGRDRLDAAAPARNRPLMTTRELHHLRLHPDPKALQRWRDGDLATRREVLAALPPLATLAPVWGDRLANEVDYLFTARELCALAADVGERPEMRINPGPAAGLGWDWAAYKGGSTDTSISGTLLVGKGARRVCVAAIWNVTPRIERERFAAALRGLLGALARE